MGTGTAESTGSAPFNGELAARLRIWHAAEKTRCQLCSATLMQIHFPWIGRRKSLTASSNCIPSVAVPFSCQRNHLHVLREFPEMILSINLPVSRMMQLIKSRISCLPIDGKLVRYRDAVLGSFCFSLNMVLGRVRYSTCLHSQNCVPTSRISSRSSCISNCCRGFQLVASGPWRRHAMYEMVSAASCVQDDLHGFSWDIHPTMRFSTPIILELGGIYLNASPCPGGPMDLCH